jgi:hypothetical protein
MGDLVIGLDGSESYTSCYTSRLDLVVSSDQTHYILWCILLSYRAMRLTGMNEQRESRCKVSTCPRSLDPLVGGPYCNLHGKLLRLHGSLEFAALKSPERRPFITAASTLLHGAPILREMTQLLESCKPYFCPQADVLRRGWTNQEKAKAILAQIHRQHGDAAALKVLAAFLGTAAMPMPTSNRRYFKIQVARAVYALCHSDNVTRFGKTTRQRIGMQGYRLPVALFELLDAITWPVKDALRTAILATTASVRSPD